MKNFLMIVFSLISFQGFSQLKNEELGKLIKIGELYSKDVNMANEDFGSSIDSLRCPELDHIIDVMKAIGSGDLYLVSDECLKRPESNELKYWYIIDQIQENNRIDDSKKSSEQVANDVLKMKLDENILIKNYYGFVRNGFAKLYNEADLSVYDLKIESYNFKNDTEKGIFYLEIMHGLGQRFLVLLKFNNWEKLLEYASKMPKVNGNPYYSYIAFSFKDFKYKTDDGDVYFLKRYLETMYGILLAHFNALAEEDRVDEAKKLYESSILVEPDYFKYSGIEKDLKEIYKSIKK